MLNDEEFQKICRLSRLHIDESDKDVFLSKLNGLFDWIKQLQDIDTSNVKLNNFEELSTQIEREDIPENLNCRDKIFSNTKFKKFDMFSVPRVVE